MSGSRWASRTASSELFTEVTDREINPVTRHNGEQEAALANGCWFSTRGESATMCMLQTPFIKRTDILYKWNGQWTKSPWHCQFLWLFPLFFPRLLIAPFFFPKTNLKFRNFCLVIKCDLLCFVYFSLTLFVLFCAGTSEVSWKIMINN